MTATLDGGRPWLLQSGKQRRQQQQQQQLPLTKKGRRSPNGRALLLAWLLSAALALLLFSTFTYQPPSHLDAIHSNQDRFHPAKLFLQQPPRKRRIRPGGDNNNAQTSVTWTTQPMDSVSQTVSNSTNNKNCRSTKDVLREASLLSMLSSQELRSLPAIDKTFATLYGPFDDNSNNNSNSNKDCAGGPVIYGMETCEAYQKLVPNVKERYTGPAGMFNTGTNNVEQTLKLNIQGAKVNSAYRLPVLYQVPWGKHRMPARRLRHVANGAWTLNQTRCLPIVIVRDPYHWMQSMCKSHYAAYWRYREGVRCPNLVASPQDLKRWGRIQESPANLSNPNFPGTTFQVKVIFDKNDIEFFDSLVELWNDWYRPYFHNPEGYPRLIIRFEDMLLHGPTIIRQISKCIGIPMKNENHFHYQLSSAKYHGSHTDFLSALLKTANVKRREAGLTEEDKKYAAERLDPELMRAFQYRPVLPFE